MFSGRPKGSTKKLSLDIIVLGEQQPATRGQKRKLTGDFNDYSINNNLNEENSNEILIENYDLQIAIPIVMKMAYKQLTIKEKEYLSKFKENVPLYDLKEIFNVLMNQKQLLMDTK